MCRNRRTGTSVSVLRSFKSCLHNEWNRYEVCLQNRHTEKHNLMEIDPNATSSNTDKVPDNATLAVVTNVFHTDIDRAWSALIDPQLVAQYMQGAKLTTDWQEGSAIKWEGTANGKAFHALGKVLQVREPDLLQFTHIDTSSQVTPEKHTITIELRHAGGATHLRLTQDNNASEDAARKSEATWTTMLDAMKRALGEAPVEKRVEARV